MTPPNSPHLDNAGDRHELEERSAGWIDYTDITPVKNWVADGGIATIGWHWLVPAYPLYGQPEVALPAHLFDKAKVGDFVQVRMDKTSAKAIAEWKDADDNSIGKVDSIKGDLMFEIAEICANDGDLVEYGRVLFRIY